MSDCPYCNRRKNFTTLFNDQDYAEVRIVMNDTLFIHQKNRKHNIYIGSGTVIVDELNDND